MMQMMPLAKHKLSCNVLPAVAGLAAALLLSGCGRGDDVEEGCREIGVGPVNVTILTDAATPLFSSCTGVSISGSQKFTWAEGPVWVPEMETWIWSDVFENTQWKYSNSELSEFSRPGFYANGNTLDRE